ncbi:MAG: ribonuclease D [Gammaproteobacteria bacterium]
MSEDFIVITTNTALLEYCEQIKGSKWLAIDTEFEREKTYYSELCLLQVTDGSKPAIIDPLSIEDLTPIMDLFYDTSIIKIFHSARQDLEIFFNLNRSIPAPLFDTQIAAPLLGFPEQIGYANLVKAMIGVELSKSHTRTDWKRRPLNNGQLQYAIDDVIYLGQIYEKMIEQLTKLDRLDWLDKDFLGMTEPDIYEPETDQVWKKIRSANRLKGKKLAVLQSLAKWREETARNENRPRNWLLRDDAMIDLSHQLPDNKNAVFSIKGIHERVARKYSAELIRIIEEAQNTDPQPIDDKKRSKSLKPEQEALVDVMMAIVRIRAAENDLSPSSLAPKKEIERLLKNEVSIVTTSWRKRMIGDELNAFLNGKISLSIVEMSLQIASK